MISMFQFMALYGGYYSKFHYFYIFTIHFLFSFTQSYLLLVVLSIDHRCFSFVCLSVVAVSAFVFVCGRCWCFCARLGSGSVPLFPRFVVAVLVWSLDRCLCFLCSCLVPGCSWFPVAVVSLLSLVCLPVCGHYWCPCCFRGCCWCFCGCVW